MITYGKGPRRVTAPGQPISYTANTYAKPRSTTAPSITGTPAVGQVLTYVPGAWTPDGTRQVVWYVAGIPVASAPTYTVQPADAGKLVWLVERCVLANGLGMAANSNLVQIP